MENTTIKQCDNCKEVIDAGSPKAVDGRFCSNGCKCVYLRSNVEERNCETCGTLHLVHKKRDIAFCQPCAMERLRNAVEEEFGTSRSQS